MAGWLFARRGNICGTAYRKTLLSTNGRATLLKDVDRNVLHVMCSTDLRTARQFYMSPKFLYGYDSVGPSLGNVSVAKAVQASAAFPGGFPPARVSRKGFAFKDTRTGEPKTVESSEQVLGDGGLYDNMADQWGRGFAERSERWPWLADNYVDPDVLIVVNSSARPKWMPFSGRLPWIGEVQALLHDMNVMYENTTAVRRQDLIGRFDRAAELGEGQRGALMMITQSPPRRRNLLRLEPGGVARPSRTGQGRTRTPR